jgi:hypothetical protein
MTRSGAALVLAAVLVAPSAVHPQTGSVNLPAELSQAEQLGIRFELIDIREVGEVEAAFDAAVRARVDALLVRADEVID